MKNNIKCMIALCASMLSASALADVAQTFTTSSSDGTAVGSASWTAYSSKATGTWSGDGKTANESRATIAVGRSSEVSDAADTKYVVVDGSVNCSDSGGSNNRYYLSEYLMRVAEPCGVLLDEREDTALVGVQIAVTAGTEVNATTKTVPVNVYCQTNSSVTVSNGWVATDVNITTGAWHRVTLQFDYANGRCRVSVDGVPCASAFGYTTPTNNFTNGAWYKLASGPWSGTRKVAAVDYLGLGDVDDVVVKQNTSSVSFTGDALASIGDLTKATVSLDDLNKWGVSTNNLATTRCDTTELTVAQKLQCGLDPTDGRKFEVLSMRETSSGNIEVTVPRTYTPTGYSITYSAKNNSGSSVGSLSGVSVSDGKATMNFNSLGTTAGVTFITVEASVP